MTSQFNIVSYIVHNKGLCAQYNIAKSKFNILLAQLIIVMSIFNNLKLQCNTVMPHKNIVVLQ